MRHLYTQAKLFFGVMVSFPKFLIGNLFTLRSPIKDLGDDIPNFNLAHVYFYLKLLLLVFVISNCEYYKAYKYNEQGIAELNEAKLEDSKTSFHKSISYTYKSEIPIYNIGNALLIEDDLPAAHEKFQQAIEANPDFKEALYNDGQALYLWGKKELNPDTCNVQRARVLWEQAIIRFIETSALPNSGDYKKPSIENAKFLDEQIATLDELEKNNCKDNKEKQEKENSDSSDKDNSPDEKDSKDKDKSDSSDKDSKDKDKSGKDGKDSKDKDKSGKDGKDSKDKDKSDKDGKDSKDKDKSGKDGKDSKDKDKSDKDGKDSKDKDKSGKDGKDSKDKDKSDKDGKDSKDKDKSGKDGKDSKDKDKSGKDGKDSKDKDKSGKDGKDSKDKDKSGKDGKDSKDKNNSGEENESEKENKDGDDQSGNNGHLPADEGGPRKPTLTPDEQKRIQSEMERIKGRSGENKSHKRSRHQQDKTNKTTEELEKSLNEALW